MLTYLATYRLRSSDPVVNHGCAAAAPTISVRILDFGLQHAAARAWWRLPTVAALLGWHPAATELVCVELMGDEAPPTSIRGGALRVAKELCGCDDDAERLVAAAAVIAGVSV